MNSNEFVQITHILSEILRKDNKVMDLCCGDSSYTRWIKSTGIANLVPVSPNALEHIRYENPFVAYNNFINDNRMMPTKDNKADVILLLGPLYNMQSEEARIETLTEAKRLLSVTGKVIILTNDKAESTNGDVISKAGFTAQSVININKKGTEIKHSKYQPKKSKKQGTSHISSYINPNKQEEYRVTIASPTVPRAVLSVDDIPPEVVIRIPDDVLERLKNKEKEYNAVAEILNKKENKQDNQYSEIPTERKAPYPRIEIKTSIDPTLTIEQNRVRKSIEPLLQSNKNPVLQSIDPTLQSNKGTTGIKMELPVLPQEIIDQYKEDKRVDNSNKELKQENKDNIIKMPLPPIPKKEEKKEAVEHDLSPDKIPKHPKIPLQPSIDKSLVMREDMSKRMKLEKIKEENSRVHNSIDKALQMTLPKIDPKFAKPKSRKKGTRNIIQKNVRSAR